MLERVRWHKSLKVALVNYTKITAACAQRCHDVLGVVPFGFQWVTPRREDNGVKAPPVLIYIHAHRVVLQVNKRRAPLNAITTKIHILSSQLRIMHYALRIS